MPSEADNLLRRMADAYAGCKTYRDEGVVSTTFFAARKRTERLPFSTRFDRTRGFLFEFRSRRGEDDWDQYAVWSENGSARRWWSLMPGRMEADSLGLALAGGTGISGGSAHRVPHLLMPELSRGGREPAPAETMACPEASQRNCVVVERPYGFGSSEQIWIDADALLIRKVVEPRHALGSPPPEEIERMKQKHPEHADEITKHFESWPSHREIEVETVTTYDPAFDASIDPAELRFIPPSN